MSSVNVLSTHFQAKVGVSGESSNPGRSVVTRYIAVSRFSHVLIASPDAWLHGRLTPVTSTSLRLSFARVPEHGQPSFYPLGLAMAEK